MSATNEKVYYEVGMQIHRDSESSFLTWLKAHVSEMLEIPGFEKCDLMKMVSCDQFFDQEKLNLVARYQISTHQALQDYFDRHATEMRARCPKDLAEKVNFSRRVLIREWTQGEG